MKVSLPIHVGGVALQFQIELKMNHVPLSVFIWPEIDTKVLLEQNLFVIAVPTPKITLRDEARKLVRSVLKQVLAIRLVCSISEIEFISIPGKVLKLSHLEHEVGLSVSHESGLSLAAVNLNGRVGIDLMLLKNAPTYDEIHILAEEYFGKEIAEYISKIPREHQIKFFTKTWTEFEARNKCLELGLIEWSLERAKPLNMRYHELVLPKGYLGTLAYHES